MFGIIAWLAFLTEKWQWKLNSANSQQDVTAMSLSTGNSENQKSWSPMPDIGAVLDARNLVNEEISVAANRRCEQ
ncbi:MAG: hypothetical protein RL211_559 [Pseudomonadota bacterium]